MIETLCVALLLEVGIYKQHVKNKKRLAAYNPKVDERFAYLAEKGICYVYEPQYFAEVWYATKVVRSPKEKNYVPMHHPIFSNNRTGEE